MGQPPWISDRDIDPRYLLGPFDANRMLRLEGLHSARAIGQAFVDLQRQYPTFLRNLQYVTSGESLGGGFMFGAIAQVAGSFADMDEALETQGKIFHPWVHPPVLALGARYFCSREAEIRAGTDGDKPRKDAVILTPPHENAHVLHNELLLSDGLLGTTYHRDLNQAALTLLPAFQPGRLSQDEIDELAEQRAFNGTGLLSDTFELSAELMRLAELQPEAIASESKAVVRAVERTREMLQHAWAPDVAAERQEALLTLAPKAWLMFDRSGGHSPLSEGKAAVVDDPENASHWSRQLAGIYDHIVDHSSERDPRFDAMTAHYLFFYRAALGLTQLRALGPDTFPNPEKKAEFSAAIEAMTLNAGLTQAR